MERICVQKHLKELYIKTAQKRMLLSHIQKEKADVIENSHYKDMEYEVCENLMRGDNQ